MSEKVKDILKAVRTRLEGVGWPIVSGRMVDLETDPLPCISLRMVDIPGILSEETGRENLARRLTRQELTLEVSVVHRIESPDTALEELEDIHTKVHAALFDPKDRRMGLLLYDDLLLESRHSFVPESYVDVGLLQMTISLPYIEEY